VDVGPLGYVARFLTMFFFVVLVHELSHALAHPRDVRGLVVGIARPYGLVLGLDVERATKRSLLAPQFAVPIFLAVLWALGWLHWVEALAMAIVNVVASAHDLSLLRRKPRPVWVRGIGVYREPPHLRVGRL